MYLYFTEELTPKRLLSVSKEVSCSLNFLCSTSLLQNMQRIQTNIVGFLFTSSVVFMVLFQIPLSDPQNFLSSLFSTKSNWKLSPKPLVFHPCHYQSRFLQLYFLSLAFAVLLFPLGYNLSIFAGGLDVTLLKFFIAYFYLLLDS